MGKFGDYFSRRGSGDDLRDERGGSDYEYYEDTHDERSGDYSSTLRDSYRSADEERGRYTSTDYRRGDDRDFPSRTPSITDGFIPYHTRDNEQAVAPSYGSPSVETTPQGRVDSRIDGAQKLGGGQFMVYSPKNVGDVEVLIDFLRTRESAIITLEGVQSDDAQRILDFVSGAIYALNGNIHRISGNIFLLSPEGVGVSDGRGKQ